MTVLLAVNKSILCCKVPLEDKLKEIVKNVITKLKSSPLPSEGEGEVDSFFETFSPHEKH